MRTFVHAGWSHGASCNLACLLCALLTLMGLHQLTETRCVSECVSLAHPQALRMRACVWLCAAVLLLWLSVHDSRMQPPMHCLSPCCASFQTRLFQRKSAAAAAMTAQRTTAAALTSTLVLSPGELEDLWSSCRHYDRDGSGLLTPAEMERVLARGVPVLSSLDASRLVDALRDNAGLLRYGALVRQIKAQSLRPGSAPPLECRVAAGSKQQAPVAARHTAAEAATEPPTCQLQLPSCQSELGSAAQEPGNTFPPSSHAAAMFRPLSAPASAARSPGWQQQQHGQGATCTSWRPSTAVPAVTRSVLMPARCAVEWRGETSAAPPSQSSTSMSRRPRSACGVRLSALRKRDEADAADRAAVRLLQ
jgi:hypothetical protein